MVKCAIVWGKLGKSNSLSIFFTKEYFHIKIQKNSQNNLKAKAPMFQNIKSGKIVFLPEIRKTLKIFFWIRSAWRYPVIKSLQNSKILREKKIKKNKKQTMNI